LPDLDRLFDAVRREKGVIDVLWASAGTGEERKLGEITEQHFDATFGLNYVNGMELIVDGGTTAV
jgi:NAD(P)-dependent dehydrogenase (short-subunit alcohol dehydrogenase family)